MTGTHHYKVVMTVLLRKECHFVMLGWDRCPGKLSDEPGAGQPGHAWDSRHSGNVESGDWSIKNVWPAGSWLPGTPAIHESCRELTRTRRMCPPVKNL